MRTWCRCPAAGPAAAGRPPEDVRTWYRRLAAGQVATGRPPEDVRTEMEVGVVQVFNCAVVAQILAWGDMRVR
jgi:hypothetical protein